MPLSPNDRTDNATARLAGLLESAMDAIITVDEAQNIILYNRAAETIFGWPAADVLGQPLVKLIPGRFHGSHAGRSAHSRYTVRLHGYLARHRCTGWILPDVTDC